MEFRFLISAVMLFAFGSLASFGKLDSQHIGNTNMHLGQELAVSYDKVRDHRKFIFRIAGPQRLAQIESLCEKEILP